MQTPLVLLLVVAALTHATVATAEDGGPDGGADAATMATGGSGGSAGSGGKAGTGGKAGAGGKAGTGDMAGTGGVPVVQRATTPDPTSCSLSAGRGACDAFDACALGVALATAGLARRRRR
jgi:hypothetical protein